MKRKRSFELDDKSRHFFALLPALESIRRRAWNKQQAFMAEFNSYPIADNVVRHLMNQPYGAEHAVAYQQAMGNQGYWTNSWNRMTQFRGNLDRAHRSTLLAIRQGGSSPYPRNVHLAARLFERNSRPWRPQPPRPWDAPSSHVRANRYRFEADWLTHHPSLSFDDY